MRGLLFNLGCAMAIGGAFAGCTSKSRYTTETSTTGGAGEGSLGGAGGTGTSNSTTETTGVTSTTGSGGSGVADTTGSTSSSGSDTGGAGGTTNTGTTSTGDTSTTGEAGSAGAPNGDCSSNPCLNGGTCSEVPGGTSCECQPGYTGETCATNVDECTGGPCLNGGTCIDGVASYSCDCALGFTGDTCETDVNECTGEPCLNGGTCIDAVGEFSCDCQPGYSGDTCATDIDDCASSPCVNGGTCIDQVNTYDCECPQGFSGDRCERTVTDCSDNPCLNGASCTNVGESYECTCAAGYSGDNCGTNINECDGVQCQNGGECIDLVANYDCECQPGYTGNLCQTNIDDCASDPCVNGGTCVDAVNAYDCNCINNWGGTTCSLKLLEGIGYLSGHNESYANAVSDDGLVVVGWSRLDFDMKPVRWDDGILSQLTPDTGEGAAYGVNHDGSQIVGHAYNSTFDADQGAQWFAAGLGYLASVTDTGDAVAHHISDDGSIASGDCKNGDSPRACVWLNTFRGVRLVPPEGYGESYVSGMTPDGSLLVGYTYEPSTAYRWTEADGWETLTAPDTTTTSARAVTPDGDVIYGHNISVGLLRWDGAAILEELGGNLVPRAVSSDGLFVVGSSGSEAAIWDATNGVRLLSNVLASIGVNLSGWSLVSANDVSANGKVIIGSGTFNGLQAGWIVRLP